MTESQMRTLIEQYLQYHYRDSSIRKLLLENNNEQQKPFIQLWIDYKGDVAAAIRETVKARNTAKSTMIQRCKDFVEWLERKTDTSFSVVWPPIDTGQDYERIVYMMRTLPELQDSPEYKNYTDQADKLANYLSDKLWVSPTTIQKDLARMSHPDHSHQTSLLNNALTVSGMTRSSGTVNIPSTAHPVLLVENLTCLSMMLNAMLEKADDPKLRDGLMLTVGHIWSQLTDYARKRVVEASIKWYGESSETVARLRNLTTTADRLQFVPESKVFSNVEGQLMYYMKTETRCLLEYEAEDSMQFCMGVPHVNLDDADSIYIQTDYGEKDSIPFNAIKSCKIEARLQ